MDVAPPPSRCLPSTHYHQQGLLGHNTGHEDDYLEEVEADLEEEMTADSGGLRGASSPQDSINRKSNKPMMEKKRRQRINRSLSDLKALLLEAAKKDPSRYSRLEKADILELTVRHIEALHRQESKAVGRGEEFKYRAGFSHCATEVNRYLGDHNEVPRELLDRLTAHLNTMSASMTNTVNSTKNTCIQNSVNVTTSPLPIILVLNTSQPTLQGGNSLGVQPLTVVTTSRAPTLLPQMAGGDVTVVLPQVGTTQRLYTRDPPSPALQASAPVLSSILTSEPGRTGMGRVVQPPALSCSSVDSALGPDTPDMFDSDLSCSGPSTPLSSLSSASSPSPLEDTAHTSPRRSALSGSSPTLPGQPWSSSIFREELGHCQSRPGPRRPQVLAPKPAHIPRIQKIPSPPPANSQSMWRPWH